MQAIYNEKNDLLSAVASDDVVDCIKHLVEYLSCRVFGQAMYRHVTFMRSITGFLKEGKGYFLLHTWEVLEEALYLKIWPEADVWLKYIETYHPDQANNEVI